ncbi:hypothetical protein CVT25_007359 [Psilocybe cyanescens]|uniref:Uncharacterized protein n=1 Tax=Psilocybe cyanescens TaxID=93625 RepID=A0A409XJE8_PSICY|nr:hypothetical protein CVT25_007359 [Psilocybe cyanescens]
MTQWLQTHPLVIDNGDFLNSAESAKLIFKVALLGTNAESEDSQHARGIWLLLGLVRLTRGAWARLGGGDLLLRYWGGLLKRPESPLVPLPLAALLTGLLERDLPRGGKGSRSAGAGAGGALYASE